MSRIEIDNYYESEFIAKEVRRNRLMSIFDSFFMHLLAGQECEDSNLSEYSFEFNGGVLTAKVFGHVLKICLSNTGFYTFEDRAYECGAFDVYCSVPFSSNFEHVARFYVDTNKYVVGFKKGNNVFGLTTRDNCILLFMFLANTVIDEKYPMDKEASPRSWLD